MPVKPMFQPGGNSLGPMFGTGGMPLLCDAGAVCCGAVDDCNQYEQFLNEIGWDGSQGNAEVAITWNAVWNCHSTNFSLPPLGYDGDAIGGPQYIYRLLGINEICDGSTIDEMALRLICMENFDLVFMQLFIDPNTVILGNLEIPFPLTPGQFTGAKILVDPAQPPPLSLAIVTLP